MPFFRDHSNFQAGAKFMCRTVIRTTLTRPIPNSMCHNLCRCFFKEGCLIRLWLYHTVWGAVSNKHRRRGCRSAPTVYFYLRSIHFEMRLGYRDCCKIVARLSCFYVSIETNTCVLLPRSLSWACIQDLREHLFTRPRQKPEANWCRMGLRVGEPHGAPVAIRLSASYQMWKRWERKHSSTDYRPVHGYYLLRSFRVDNKRRVWPSPSVNNVMIYDT